MAKATKKANQKSKERTSGVSGFTKEKEEKLELGKMARDERIWKIVGMMFLLIAIFFTISFVSYFFTWREDYVQVSKGSDILWQDDVSVQNLMGKLGALSGHLYIKELFGVAAILISTFFFVVGINLLFRRKVFSVWRNLKYVTFGMLLVSTILSFLLKNQEFSWGGGLGKYVSNWLQGNLGQMGTAAALLLIVIAYLIWQFNPVFSFPKKLVRQQEGIDGVVDDSIDSQIDLTTIEDNESSAPIIEEVAQEKQVETAAKLIIDTEVEKPKYDFQLHLKDEKQAEAIAIVSENMTEKVVAPIVENSDINSVNVIAQPILPEKEAADPSAVSKGNKSNEPNLKLEINKGPLIEPEVENPILAAAEKQEPYEPTLDLKDYKYPSLDLLENYGSEHIQQDPAELETNKNQIINTLRNYDIEIQKISATIGPTVTLYEIVPAAGVRISRIKNLEDDIALSLSALGIRIIAPIPGRGTIGIEVPNAKKTIVSMRTLLASDKFKNSNFALPIALGKKIDNENFIVDLAAMPHLLMAGATGQGKSVGINTILVSLLYKKHPSQLKFVLVDPKKVELSIYSHIRNHFLASLPNEEDAIITDTKKVINTLNALSIEMDDRYDLLKDAGCRNIKEYNAKFISRRLNPQRGHKYLPFIVLVIDEFADLIMTAGKEIEMPIARLAQLARAVGIHLVIATQRPSVNIITGIIKANFPARVAFKVSSKIDSRTIMDAGGAEQLIGKGDMLINHNGELVRLQCAFVDTPEVDRIVEFVGYQEGYPQPFLLPEYIDEKDLEAADFDINDRDALFEDAAKLIVANQIGSTSLLQRRMKLGYNRAGRLMDQLEAAGIVGPNQGSKAREVLIKTEVELQQHLDALG